MKKEKRFKLPEDKKSLRQAHRAAVDFLKLCETGEPENEAGLIIEKITGFSFSGVILNAGFVLNSRQITSLEEMLTKRSTGMPVQHILNEAWFYGRSFYIDKRALIPRFDTEALIEEALKYVDEKTELLDMCTGSGCILITLVKETGANGTGADISDEALAVAELNAERLGAGCRLIKSDLFENVPGKYDVIVSNPPYIRTEVIAELQCEVRDFDPVSALDGGGDGLTFYRRIIPEAGVHLNEGGHLLLEIGYDQSEAVSKLLRENGFGNITVKYDLGNNPRVVSGVWGS